MVTKFRVGLVLEFFIISIVLIVLVMSSLYLGFNVILDKTQQLNILTNEIRQTSRNLVEVETSYDKQVSSIKEQIRVIVYRQDTPEELNSFITDLMGNADQMHFKLNALARSELVSLDSKLKVTQFINDNKASLDIFQNAITAYLLNPDQELKMLNLDKSLKRYLSLKTQEDVITAVQDDFRVSEERSVKQAQSEVEIQAYESMFTVMAILLVSVSFAVFRIMGPMRRIGLFSSFLIDTSKVDESEAHSQTYIDVRSQKGKRDEISMLIRQFNRYSSIIRNYSASLEQKIAERTQEIQEALKEIEVLNLRLSDENQRMAGELDVAREIQLMVLPSDDEIESFSELSVGRLMQPADEVGGDYFDMLRLDSGEIMIGIGDVTGHGLSSGVLMLMTQTGLGTLSAGSNAGNINLANHLVQLNRILTNNVERTQMEKSLTLSLLSYKDGKCTITGNHETVMICRKDGTQEEIDTSDLGCFIGIIDDIDGIADTLNFHLDIGDTVLLYTDGATEAANPAMEEFGSERLMASFAKHNHLSTGQEVVDAIKDDVFSFIDTQKVFDDLTMLLFRRLS